MENVDRFAGVFDEEGNVKLIIDNRRQDKEITIQQLIRRANLQDRVYRNLKKKLKVYEEFLEVNDFDKWEILEQGGMDECE